MKNNNKVNTKFYEPNMKPVQTDVSKSISDRLDKMESMLLYSIDKMDIIDRKLDDFMGNINIRTVGQVYKNDDKGTEEETWYDELKSKMNWIKK
jgi:hypothetical protein